MTTKKLFIRSIAAMGVLLAVSAPALAGKAGEFTAGLNAEYFWPGHELHVKRANGVRGDFGYRITDEWAISGSYTQYQTEAQNHLAGKGGHDVDLDSYRLDAQYFFNTASDTQPYISLGLKKFDDDIKIADAADEDGDFDTQLSLGAGVRHYLTKNLSLNGGVNLNNDFSGMSDRAVHLGVAFHFGGGEEAAPASEPAAPVAPAACADGDADGVCDNVDQCPGTPPGVSVDATGCPATMIKEDVTIEMKVLFDTDKSVVKDEYLAEVEKVASFLKEHGNTDATIEGHTDSTASDAYNQALSERRANAVRELLVSKYGIDAARLKAAGYGEARPVSDNGTVEGRAQNRRVISVIVTQVEKAK